MLNIKQFNYYLNLMRLNDSLGVFKIQYEYMYQIKYTALINLKDIKIADDAITAVTAYILYNSKKIDYIDNPSEFIFKVTDRITKDYKQMPNNIPPKHISHIESQFAERFITLPRNEQESFILYCAYMMNENDIAKCLNRPAEVIKSEIDIACEKMDYLTEMFCK